MSAGAHTFSMFFPQGDESALVIPPTFPIFDCPGTVLPARGQQKRRPCRNADLHRAALLFPEHQTTIFPYEKTPFSAAIARKQKRAFSFVPLRGCWIKSVSGVLCDWKVAGPSPCRVWGNRSCVKYSTHSAKRKVIFQIPLRRLKKTSTRMCYDFSLGRLSYWLGPAG